ncbi:MAG: response regulator [Rickettsiales bacterium]|nr:response regulator [Rickettsiales bacterium]
MKQDNVTNQSSKLNLNLLKNKRVLVADDEQTNRMILAKYLENYGMIVDQVNDGKELIDKYITSTAVNQPFYMINVAETKGDVNNDQYDLIITDIHMPTMDGVLATKEIRKYEKQNNLRPIPIVAFTGDEDEKKIESFYDAGVNDYFAKGKDNEYLIRIMVFWIGNSSNASKKK